MNIQKRFSSSGVTVYIDPYYNGVYNRKWITVCKEQGFINKKVEYEIGWKPATINWSCTGEVSPKDANLFAEAMKVAVEIANMLDTEIWKVTAINENASKGHQVIEQYFDSEKEGHEWCKKAQEKEYTTHLEPIILG